MKRNIERVDPAQAASSAAARKILTSGARRRVTFELTPHAHTLLKEEGKRRRLSQVALLELIIRDYCNPARPNANRSF